VLTAPTCRRTVTSWLQKGASVIATDAASGLVAVYKPAGCTSHPNDGNLDEINKSLVRLPYDPVAECFLLDQQQAGGEGAPTRWFLLHRLDSATSGVVLLCSDPMAAAAVKRAFAARTVSKLYNALVFAKAGALPPAGTTATWTDPIAVKKRPPTPGARRGKGTVRASAVAVGDTQGAAAAATAVTEATVVAAVPFSLPSAPGHVLALLELRPKTGYTHQLRHQCALHGLPIVGDRVYGDFKLNKAFVAGAKASRGALQPTRRCFLHHHRVEVVYDGGGGGRTFSATAPLPTEFQDVLRLVATK
jgi:23S rRNA-/tRNA-specific pseudouridylate synthase